MSFLRVIEKAPARVRVEHYKAGAVVIIEAGERVAKGRSLEEAAEAWIATDRAAELEAIEASGAPAPADADAGPYLTHEEHALPGGGKRVIVWSRKADGALIEVLEEEHDHGQVVARARNGVAVGVERGPK